MLRRRKNDVEGELPGRIDKNYFVPMTAEQKIRYEEYNMRVARLMYSAKRRPLRKEEWEKLQKWLACMRMLCDATYILDPEHRDSPKLKELEKIFYDLLASKENKIIIFSEWTRMLELISELADDKGIDYALHTGSLTQAKRRAEINRFKNSPECRLFLSSDAGSTGLNLQNANIVINIDLPWNPAKLEQRIARAWRKHQTRPVQVINLVCENSIEHRMLHLLKEKKSLSQEVVDGLGEKSVMRLPSGRAAFMQRMETLLGEEASFTQTVKVNQAKPEISPSQKLKEDSVSQWGEHLDLLQVYQQDDKHSVVAVIDHHESILKENLHKSVVENLPDHQLEIIDRETFNIIQRLAQAGVLTLNKEAQTLHQSQQYDKKQEDYQNLQLVKARKHFKQAEHKFSMAKLLNDGGFTQEAVPALCEAVEGALESLAVLDKQATLPLSISYIESHLITNGIISENTLGLLAQLRDNIEEIRSQRVVKLLKEAETLLQQVDEALTKFALHHV